MYTVDLAAALSRESMHGVELYEHLVVVVASIIFWAANPAYTPPFVLPRSRALFHSSCAVGLVVEGLVALLRVVARALSKGE